MKHFKKLNQTGFDHVMMVVAFVLVFGVLGTLWFVVDHAAAWSGTLHVYSQDSDYCLTSNGGSEGDTVALNTCSKTKDTDQVWTLNDTGSVSMAGKTYQGFELQSGAGSNECLDNWQSSTTNGTQTRLYPCSGSDKAEVWMWGTPDESAGFSSHQMGNLGSFSAARGTWLCLDDSGGSDAANTKVDIYTCKTNKESQSNQEWFENTIPSGTTTTAPTPAPTTPSTPTTTASWTGALQLGLDKSLCMANDNDSTVAYTAVLLNTCKDTAAQSWTIERLSTDSSQFELKAAAGNLCLDDPGDGTTSSSSARDYLQTITCSTTDHAQIWQWAGSGDHELQNVYNTDACVNDAASSKSTSNNILIAYPCTGSPTNSEWYEAGL